MHKFHPTTLPGLILILLLSLMGCSSSNEETEDSNVDTDYNQSEELYQDEPNHEELMAADGWRKGKLRIEIDIQQRGGHNEQELVSDWTSVIKAISEVDIMAAEDLRPYVSAPPLTDVDALEYEPFSLLDPDANNILSSEVNYASTWKVTTSDAKEEKQGTYTGVVDRVYLHSLNPSLYGPGYEAYVKIYTKGQLKTHETLSGYGQPPIVTDKDEERTEELEYILHPVPNANKLNDYEFLPEGLDDIGREAITRQKMDMLSLLNELNKDALPVQMEIRAGMVSEATKDSLTMTYEYTGNKVVGHAAMMNLNAGMANQNRTKIRIQLIANP